ncbi:TPA: hypothetical protein ACKRID_003404 [Proteus mirabilis]
MKERGIIFNTEMVKAILDGRKTQTRRVMNNQPCTLSGETISVQQDDFNFRWAGDLHNDTSGWFPCPLGKVGDRLWVRETFALLGNEDGFCVDWNDNILKAGEEQAAIIYKASCEKKDGDYGLWSIPDDADWKPHTDNRKYEGAWRPSIHMPRWASRITLEITDVRVERLNDISQSDAIAEGAPPSHPTIDAISRECGFPDFSRSWFGQTWWHIYGKKNWQDNPWVWVIEFKRI